MNEGAMASVLIIEDETGIATMLAERLSRSGYTVSVAEDGERALELVEQRKPDVILADLYLPRMDGEQLIRALRARGCSTPVILMTASNQGELVAVRAGAVDYLEKPFDMAVAIAAIENAMRPA
jgi:DNA-binding response OmpR family regulator